MDQWIKVLATKSDDLSLILGTPVKSKGEHKVVL